MEQQNIPQKQEKKKTNIGSLLLLIGLLLIFAGVTYQTFFIKEEVTETEQPQEETQQPSEGTHQENENKLGQTIELSKETEDITFDEHLRIKFIGTASTDMEGAYKYKAEIYLDNEIMKDNFFTGSNIYSSNYAANVKVYKLEGTYIITSFIAKQCGGTDVLVLAQDKTAMTPYSDVTLDVNAEASNYTITKCSDCMNTSSCQQATTNVPKLTK